MTTSLILKFDYFTNFSIKSNWSLEADNSVFRAKFVKTTSKQICKNFILLLTFLKYLNTVLFNKSVGGLLVSVFVKPSKQNIFNYLRAPYKNKLSRNQLYTPRFKLTITVVFKNSVCVFFKNPSLISGCINFFKKNLFSMESNILYLNKLRISYRSYIVNYWNYKSLQII